MDGNFLFILVAVFGFVAVAGLGLALAGGGTSGRTTKRVQAVSAGRGTAKAAAVGRGGRAETAVVRRKALLQTLKQAEQQERRAKLTLSSRLEQAGLSMTVRTFWIVSGVLALVGLVLGFMFSHNPLAALGCGFAIGLGLPRWWLAFVCKSRGKKFTAEFPNAIDIIVRGIKSGLPVNDCLKVIASESPEPVGSEFRRMVDNLGGGVTMDQAMEKMYTRMPLPEVRFFSIVLAIQQKTGGNLAEALNNLSSVLRARKLMVEKVKALSGEAVASAFIIGALPPGIVVLVQVTSPAYMIPLWTTSGGHFALAVGAGMMGMGIFVMRRMINFKI